MVSSRMIDAESCRFKQIVDHAREDCLKDFHKDRVWFKSNFKTLADAIEGACLSKFPSQFSGDLVIHGHQRRCGELALGSGLIVAARR